MPESTNVMRTPTIEKVVVNIGVGEAGERLIKAEEVIQDVTGAQAVRTRAKRGARDWGVRRGQPIGVKVTLRGEDAEEFLKKALWARNNQIADYSFDDNGNLSFGITDHTDFKHMKYDPDTGIFGLDIAVVIERPGSRIKRRRIRPAKVPKDHKVTREEAMQVMTELGAEVIEFV